MQTSRPALSTNLSHNPSQHQCGIDCEYHIERDLTPNDLQQGLCWNRHHIDNLTSPRSPPDQKSNKPPGQGRLIHTCVPPGLYQTHALLQEHEHCRPRTLPCAASFLHSISNALRSAALEARHPPSPSAETCNSTVVDPPCLQDCPKWGVPFRVQICDHV